MIRYKIIFIGRVQRVGFRIFVSRTATAMNLTGFVRNLNNGNVETEIQGSEAQISKFINKIELGNGLSVISDYSIDEINFIENEDSFVIR